MQYYPTGEKISIRVKLVKGKSIKIVDKPAVIIMNLN